MFDPEVIRAVRVEIPPQDPGPQSWQRPLKEHFGGPGQRELALQMVAHVEAAKVITDLEPTLGVYSYDPPIGFHLVIVDPYSRAALAVWEREVPERASGIVIPEELWVALLTCTGRDRTPPGGYIIREVPISELLKPPTMDPTVVGYPPPPIPMSPEG